MTRLGVVCALDTLFGILIEMVLGSEFRDTRNRYLDHDGFYLTVLSRWFCKKHRTLECLAQLDANRIKLNAQEITKHYGILCVLTFL